MIEEASHIAFVCSRLDAPGGIERAIVNTANLFQSKGHNVTLLVLDVSRESFYPLHEAILLKQAPLNFGITSVGNTLTKKISFLRHIKKLKTIFSELKPQVIIGTEYALSIASYLAGRNCGAKLFAWEHHHFHWLQKSRFWNYLYKQIYPKLTSVICLNNTEQHLFQEFGCKVVVIPNFITRQKKAASNSKTILSIGWLIKRKGFDRIPQIAEKIFKEFSDWQWIIIGAGEEELLLKKEISNRHLDNHVSLTPPLSSHLENTYSDTAIYVMTSRFECFPMVLLEAMSHGIPCVAFNCPTGPAFIINDKIDGSLIDENDVDAMVNEIRSLINDQEKRAKMGDAAYQNIARFSPDKIYALWKNLFAEYSCERTSE